MKNTSFKTVFFFIILLSLMSLCLPAGAQSEKPKGESYSYVTGSVRTTYRPITKVDLGVSLLNLNVGESYTFKVSYEPAEPAYTHLYWTVSDETVISVDPVTFTVKALKPGTATVTAIKGKKKYKCKVTVASGNKKTLIIYFSATGTTKKAAEKLKKAANADIVRIVPRTKYLKKDLNYNKNCRANSEQNRNKYVAIATAITDIKKYDTIYLGYPIWWGKEPGVIRMFLKKNKLNGKTVVPFCTSGGSGISGSMKHIRSLAKGTDVKNGKDLTDCSADEIWQWAESRFSRSNSNKNRSL